MGSEVLKRSSASSFDSTYAQRAVPPHRATAGQKALLSKMLDGADYTRRLLITLVGDEIKYFDRILQTCLKLGLVAATPSTSKTEPFWYTLTAAGVKALRKQEKSEEHDLIRRQHRMRVPANAKVSRNVDTALALQEEIPARTGLDRTSILLLRVMALHGPQTFDSFKEHIEGIRGAGELLQTMGRAGLVKYESGKYSIQEAGREELAKARGFAKPSE